MSVKCYVGRRRRMTVQDWKRLGWDQEHAERYAPLDHTTLDVWVVGLTSGLEPTVGSCVAIHLSSALDAVAPSQIDVTGRELCAALAGASGDALRVARCSERANTDARALTTEGNDDVSSVAQSFGIEGGSATAHDADRVGNAHGVKRSERGALPLFSSSEGRVATAATTGAQRPSISITVTPVRNSRSESGSEMSLSIQSGSSCSARTVTSSDISAYRLPHHVRHSPTAFEVGHAGSGPSELARCILLDHFNLPGGTDADWESPRLPLSYQRFKFDVIARLAPDQPWSISSQKIGEWVAHQQAKRASSDSDLS